MSYLFLIDEKKKAILHPYAVKLCPELAVLTDKEVLFIILAFDYNSPYRLMNDRDRLSKSIWEVWGDNKPDVLDESKRSKKLQLGIEAYKSLQYNPNQELIAVYQKKIQQAQSQIMGEDAPTRLKNLREIISGFRKDIHDLQTEVIASNILESELKGDRELSLLESWQSNIDMYNSLRTSKR
jgi:hypothetical protein